MRGSSRQLRQSNSGSNTPRAASFANPNASARNGCRESHALSLGFKAARIEDAVVRKNARYLARGCEPNLHRHAVKAANVYDPAKDPDGHGSTSAEATSNRIEISPYNATSAGRITRRSPDRAKRLGIQSHCSRPRASPLGTELRPRALEQSDAVLAPSSTLLGSRDAATQPVSSQCGPRKGAAGGERHEPEAMCELARSYG